MSRVGGGARTKPRTSQDVCADCGAPDPGWASINRGILICDECCSVHRSLGRHISQVKSLKKGTWNPTQYAMVHTLYSSGANNIWEHTLLDPSVAKTGRRKPHPKDPVHPTKADFIRAKHQMLSFVYRPSRDDPSGNDGDVSRQLHSSVRTANLETSLRLLSQGADPNYYHKEKSCCPLHVAARAGQASQVELLIVYGADPGALDSQGNTPAHYARESNHVDLAEHLIECQYELTDRLAFYLCGRKPDHGVDQHWIIPEMADSLDMSDLAKEARIKLQGLPNHLFEELACDVYDEVDRRETDSIWLSLQNQSALVSDRCTVPFLPVNPEYSSTRNQGRQKLARFNAREFATLIIDVLSDAKRRQSGISSPCATPKDKAVTTAVQRADRARDPFLACPSPTHLFTNPEDHSLPSALSLSSDTLASDLGDVTLTLPNSPKVNLHNNNNMSLNARLITPPTSVTASVNYSPVLVNKDPQHLRQVINSVTSISSSASLINPSATDSSGTSSSTGLSTNAVTDTSSCTSSTGLITSAITDIPSGPSSLTFNNTITANNNNKGEMTDDGEPLYDSVASEDDYSCLEQNQKLEQQKQILEEQRRQHQLDELYSGPNSEVGSGMESAVSLEAYLEMKEKLESSEARIQELQNNNAHMRSQLDELSSTVKSLRDENMSLRSMYSSGGVGGNLGPSSLSSTPPLPFYPSAMTQSLHNGDVEPQVNMRSSRGPPQRPFSMFEPRQGPPGIAPQCHPMDQARTTSYQLGSVRMSGEYDNTRTRSPSLEPSETTPLNPSYGLPTQEEVVRKTEVITKRIQELLISAQEGRQEAFMPCADQIHSAVLDMDAIFPKARCSPGVQGALRQLVSSAGRLQSECCGHLVSHAHTLDPKFVTQQVIQCAYDIAKGAKVLVTHFQ
ncbi:ARF GTPase-activating protein GIT1-like isoform X2 [Homarus americanus]|uniref:ARF GTPase-activating protein GIT1-like isoform X2 n=1 Tax=Homarus americanus TaxID=6706 RepID=UPI001C468D7D|nr:ARF GTPase-activating protein GIT1-like isoform X2 [Homarus americanus]